MKDDGRLKSVGILIAMIAVVLGFFAIFQRESRPIVVRTLASSSATSHGHKDPPLPLPLPAVPEPGITPNK